MSAAFYFIHLNPPGDPVSDSEGLFERPPAKSHHNAAPHYARGRCHGPGAVRPALRRCYGALKEGGGRSGSGKACNANAREPALLVLKPPPASKRRSKRQPARARGPLLGRIMLPPPPHARASPALSQCAFTFTCAPSEQCRLHAPNKATHQVRTCPPIPPFPHIMQQGAGGCRLRARPRSRPPARGRQLLHDGCADGCPGERLPVHCRRG